MAATKTTPGFKREPRIWGQMPARIKVLYITSLKRTGGWLAEAFAADCAAEVVLVEAVGVADGLAQLRDEVFDAVLVSHEPAMLDALELVEGLRAGGHEEPMIVLGTAPGSEMCALFYEVGADAYCSIRETTTRSLLWTFARAIERHQLVREHRRLVQWEQQRLSHEHQEADRLLAEQRKLIAELELIRDRRGGEGENGRGEKLNLSGTSQPPPLLFSPSPTLFESCSSQFSHNELPDRLTAHYRELLRAYVVMGAGNMSEELTALTAMLVDARVSAQQTMQLHVRVLEELVATLGNRSARHVMTRADLLVLEVMAHLADEYRRRYDGE
jgi:hypothetical protein